MKSFDEIPVQSRSPDARGCWFCDGPWTHKAAWAEIYSGRSDFLVGGCVACACCRRTQCLANDPFTYDMRLWGVCWIHNVSDDSSAIRERRRVSLYDRWRDCRVVDWGRDQAHYKRRQEFDCNDSTAANKGRAAKSGCAGSTSLTAVLSVGQDYERTSSGPLAGQILGYGT